MSAPTCHHCAALGIERDSTVSWIVHTSAEEAIRYKVPKATLEDCVLAMKHMDLAVDTRVTLLKKLTARIRKLSPKVAQVSQPAAPDFALTSRESWKALGAEEQWTLFSRVEMDASCNERALRQKKEEMDRVVQELQSKIARLEREAERDAQIQRQRQDDSWKIHNANRVLRRQVEEAGLIPLA